MDKRLQNVSDSSEFWKPCTNGLLKHTVVGRVYKEDGINTIPFYTRGILFEYPDGTICAERDSPRYIDLPCMNMHELEQTIKVDSTGRCIDEAEYLKYIRLDDDLVFFDPSGRMPYICHFIHQVYTDERNTLFFHVTRDFIALSKKRTGQFKYVFNRIRNEYNNLENEPIFSFNSFKDLVDTLDCEHHNTLNALGYSETSVTQSDSQVVENFLVEFK